MPPSAVSARQRTATTAWRWLDFAMAFAAWLSERMGGRAAKWAMARLKARGHEAVLVDAQALKLPILDKMWKEIKTKPSAKYAKLHAKLAPLAKLYVRVDGFCI